jgi:hypothetical protein
MLWSFGFSWLNWGIFYRLRKHDPWFSWSLEILTGYFSNSTGLSVTSGPCPHSQHLFGFSSCCRQIRRETNYTTISPLTSFLIPATFFKLQTGRLLRTAQIFFISYTGWWTIPQIACGTGDL